MRSRLKKSFGLLICFVAFATIVSGQSPEPITWQSIVSSNGEFSVSVPGTIVVSKDQRWNGVSIVGGEGGAGFYLSFRKTSDGDDMVERALARPERKGSESAFDIGSSRVRLYNYEGKKIYRTTISVGTKKAYYSLSISAASESNIVLRSVLASMRLNGQAVLHDVKVSPPATTTPLNVKDLKVSDLVRAALKRKQTDRIVAEVAKTEYEQADSEIIYSRPVLVLRHTPATYSAEARNNNITGAVRLRIQLKGNGNVGRVIVLKGLPHGLTEQAIRAAAEIKFVPAEIDGKPGDAEVTREYTFSIY